MGKQIGYVVAAVVIAAGCGKAPVTPTAPATSAAPAATGPSIETVKATDIGPVGETAPPVDGGRLEVAGPADWSLAARRSEWLIAFRLEPDTAYPIVMIEGADAAGAPELTAENVQQLAEELKRNQSQQSAGQPVRPADRPRALRIGDRYWVQYARQAKAGDTALERLFLVTVAGSRRYTVELRAHFGTRDTFRPQALAVASSLKHTANPASAPASGTNSPPEGAPPATPQPPSEATGPPENAPAEGAGSSAPQ